MDDATAQKLIAAIEPQISRHTGNIILMVGSSQCGKSTLTAKVLFEIFKFSNGYITTFMSPNYDSIPIQKMIVESLAVSAAQKAKLNVQLDKAAATSSGDLLNLKIDDMYKVKEWILTKRGFDKAYCEKIYGLRLMLNKHYGESEKVREYRFVLILDDEIDIGGSLIRKVCLTWRNRGISWVQLVQDITNLDCAVRNSAPIVFFGYMNFPHRREQIVRGYLAPYLPGLTVQEKMDSYLRLTENKCFILMNHRERQAWHLNTQTGEVVELRELTTVEDHALSTVEETQSQRLTKEGKEVVACVMANPGDGAAKLCLVKFLGICGIWAGLNGLPVLLMY